jgi:hypothetical protein
VSTALVAQVLALIAVLDKFDRTTETPFPNVYERPVTVAATEPPLE